MIRRILPTREIPHRMNAAVELHAHQLARGAFEDSVRYVRVRPFDHHRFVIEFSGRGDCRRRAVILHDQAGHRGVVGDERSRQRDVLHVNRVEAAIARVVGIELEADEATGKTVLGGKPIEQPGVQAAPVEVEILDGLLVGAQDVERPIEVVDPEAAWSRRFLADEVDPRE